MRCEHIITIIDGLMYCKERGREENVTYARCVQKILLNTELRSPLVYLAIEIEGKIPSVHMLTKKKVPTLMSHESSTTNGGKFIVHYNVIRVIIRNIVYGIYNTSQRVQEFGTITHHMVCSKVEASYLQAIYATQEALAIQAVQMYNHNKSIDKSVSKLQNLLENKNDSQFLQASSLPCIHQQ